MGSKQKWRGATASGSRTMVLPVAASKMARLRSGWLPAINWQAIEGLKRDQRGLGAGRDGALDGAGRERGQHDGAALPDGDGGLALGRSGRSYPAAPARRMRRAGLQGLQRKLHQRGRFAIEHPQSVAAAAQAARPRPGCRRGPGG